MKSSIEWKIIVHSLTSAKKRLFNTLILGENERGEVFILFNLAPVHAVQSEAQRKNDSHWFLFRGGGIRNVRFSKEFFE